MPSRSAPTTIAVRCIDDGLFLGEKALLYTEAAFKPEG